MHGTRIESFTKRQVRARERLYDPNHENTSWPDDPDHGANWDWLIFIICAFGIVAALGSIGIILFISSFFIVWP